MSDKDMQTIYLNKKTGEVEWRCRYCPAVYAISGSTSGPIGHLVKDYEFKSGNNRDAKAV
jgi:hypothetical protein